MERELEKLLDSILQVIKTNFLIKLFAINFFEGPLFDVNDPSMRLNSDSGDYVECVHTGYMLGIRAPICQADFFMNKGSHQPGCANFFGIDVVTCSHYRAVFYFIEALKNQKAFYGIKCSDLNQVLSGSCIGDVGEFMGNSQNDKIEGIFSVTTAGQSPFGLGRN